MRRPLRGLLAFCALGPAGFAPAPAGASAQWDGIAYLESFEDGRILRFDLAQQTWLAPLPPVTAAFRPTELAVDASGVYQLLDGDVVRTAHDGSAPETLWAGEASAFALDAQWLFVLDGGFLRALRKGDGMPVSEREVPAKVLAPAAAVGRVVVADPGFGAVAYDADGTLGPFEPHDDRGLDLRVFALRSFPDGARVVDQDGRIFAADGLRYLGSVPVSPGTLAFLGDALIVGGRGLWGSTSIDLFAAFSDETFEEIGRVPFDPFWSHVFVYDGTWTAIDPYYDVVRSGTLASFERVAPEEPVDPDSVYFTPGPSVVTSGGVAVVASGHYPTQIVRWSTGEGRYLPTLALDERPEHLLYDADADLLYVVYGSRRVTRIASPGEDGAVEQFLFSLPEVPYAAALAAGRLVVLGWDFDSPIFVFEPSGELVHAFAAPLYSQALASGPGRVLYLGAPYFGISRLELDGQGQPGPLRTLSIDESCCAPLLPSAEGAYLLDDARVRDGATLAPLAELRFSPVRQWWGSRLVLADGFDDTRLSTWDPPFLGEPYEVDVPGGAPTALLPFGDALLLVQRRYGGGLSFVKLYPGEDLDGDGVPNEVDLFALDPTEQSDRDGDGFGDNGDAFPDDPSQHADRDRDRIPDPLDLYPDDAELASALASFALRTSVRPYGYLAGSLYAHVHLFEDQRFLLCPQDAPAEACIPGGWRPTRRGRLEIAWPEEVVAAFAAGLEGDLEDALSSFKGRPVNLALEIPTDRIRMRAAVRRDGTRLRLTIKLPYVATTSDLAERTLRGTFRIRGDAATLAH